MIVGLPEPAQSKETELSMVVDFVTGTVVNPTERKVTNY